MRPQPKLTRTHYERLASLRHTLQQFLRFSQEAAEGAGLTSRQHQALLAIKGHAGREPVSVGELARRLHLHHHSAVGLVDRLVRRQLVRRVRSRRDRRRVGIKLTARGAGLIRRLSAAHWRELHHSGPAVRRALDAILDGAE